MTTASEADATLVTKMQAAGAVLLGGLNMGEYAYDFTGENIHDGASLNPHDPLHMSGGSSGGSGTAVASGMVAASLGSSTNGSIRVPSSFCGLFGLEAHLRPAQPRRHLPVLRQPRPSRPDRPLGHRPCVAPRRAAGRRSGRPGAGPAASPVAAMAEIGKGIDGLRIAVAGGYFRDPQWPAANAAVDAVAAALGVRGEVEIPEAARARAAAYLITNAEAATLHLPRLRTRAEDFDPDVRDRLLSGAMLPA